MKEHVITLITPCIFAAECKKPIYTVNHNRNHNCNHAFFPIIVIVITVRNHYVIVIILI